MEKRRNKKAQFFLLAAVIISAIVINLGFVANQARITREPKEFSEYSFSIKTEAGSVIDFEIYSGIEEQTNLTDFLNKTAEELKDRDPELQFILIYGNQDNLTIANYGDKEIVKREKGEGKGKEEIIRGAGFKVGSKIRMGKSSIFKDIDATLMELISNSGAWTANLQNIEEIKLTIEETIYELKVSKQRQFIIILYRESGDEIYVAK